MYFQGLYEDYDQNISARKTVLNGKYTILKSL